MQPLLVLTIGQSPRPDIEAELSEVLGDHPIELRGALDGMTLEQIDALPPSHAADTLHTRLAPTEEEPHCDVVVSKSAVTSRLTGLLDQSPGRPTLVACTGHFVDLPARPNVLFPSVVLDGLIDATIGDGATLGVLVPLPEQVEPFRRARSRPGRPAVVASVKPGEDPTEAAAILRSGGVDLVVLDCFGYDRTMLDDVRRLTERPVLSAVRATAHLAAELLA